MEIEPRPKVIVLKLLELKQRSPGGIMLPDNTKRMNENKVAVVHKIGSDIEGIKEGDTVAFSSSYVDVVALSREDIYVFCKEENILAVLR